MARTNSRILSFFIIVFAGLLLACDAGGVVQDALGITTPVPASPTTGAPPSALGPSGIITGVTLAQNTQGDNREPVGSTTNFSGNSVIHAVVGIKDAPTGSQFRAAWYAENIGNVGPANTLIDQFDVASDGTRNIDFTLTPKTTWPTGKYRVEIFVNGSLEQVVNFSVE